MKICTKCKVEKELSMFYSHPKTVDKHSSRCISCTKEDTKLRELKLSKDYKWIENEKIRAKDKYHRLNYKQKQHIRQLNKPYDHNIYGYIHAKMKLSKNERAHHWNYKFLEDIIIIDKAFHRFIHKYLNYDNETLCFRTITNELLSTKELHLKYISDLKYTYETLSER